jgi:hypothetical protein
VAYAGEDLPTTTTGGLTEIQSTYSREERGICWSLAHAVPGRVGLVAAAWMYQAAPILRDLFRPNNVSFIYGDRSERLGLIEQISDATGQVSASVTEAALCPIPATSVDDVAKRLKGRSLLFDLEAICWSPWLRLDLLRFLRLHARNHGVISAWPGHRVGRALTFSQPGRPDYVNFDARGLALLHPTKTRFPDELPFTLERITI